MSTIQKYMPEAYTSDADGEASPPRLTTRPERSTRAGKGVGRLAAIAQLVLRRASTRPGRGLLVAAGIAIACALVAGLAGGSLAARDRSLQRTIAQLPEAQRAVRVGWSGTSPGPGFAKLDRDARAALRPLGSAPARSVEFRALHLNQGPVQIAAIDSLRSFVRLDSGRLPRVCDPDRCEVLALSGHPPSRLDAAGLHFRIVGRGSLTSKLPLGDVLVHEPGMPAAPIVVASGVRTLTALPALTAIFRGYSWAAALRPRSLHVWNVGSVLADVANGETALQLHDSAFGVVAPVDQVLAARDSGQAAARRILLVGGEAAALVLAFAVLAAAGLRRDVEAERQRLEHHGASRSQSSLLALAEAGIAATLGTVAGLIVGIAATVVIATQTGLPAIALARHALGSPLVLLLVVGCGTTAAALVAGRLLVSEPDSRRARVGALDAAAIAAALAVVLALVRGPATADELQHGQGAGILLLALPALVALATGVLLARLLGPLIRLAERAGRRAAPAPRLALLALARGRDRTAATAAFLAVSTGLAVFAVVYSSTLTAGDRDQAAFRVPLDFTASQGTTLTRPLDAASRATWQGIAPGATALPILRVPASVLLRNGSFVSPDLIGLPPSGLPALEAIGRAGLDTSPAAVGELLGSSRGAQLRGLRLPASAHSLSLDGTATGVPVALTLTIATRRGDIDLVSLKRAGSAYRGALPTAARGGLVIGVEFDPPEGNAKADAHQAAEGVQGAASQKGAMLLGPIRVAGRAIGDLRTFVGRGGAHARVEPGGLRASYTLNGSARAYIRPREPFDSRPLPLLASPDVARAAGPGGLLAIQVDGLNLRGRVVATASRFPTEADTPFLVADEASLAAALAADSPADSLPSELWLGVPSRSIEQASRALKNPPFSRLTITSRRSVEHALRDDPLARGMVLALAAGAAVALILAMAGLLLAVVSDLRDERGTLADLEAQGLPPGELRLHMRLRAAMLVAVGLVGGVGVGAALLVAVHDALLTAATIGDPVPPLKTAVPWLALAFGLLLLAVVALLAVEGPLRIALRGASPRRQAGGGW